MNELTLKQKDKIAKNIYKNYKRAQLDILYLNQHYNYYPQIDLFKIKDSSGLYKNGDETFIYQLERKQQLETYINAVNQIHKHLSKDNFEFLENEYLNFYDAIWWLPYYSRASYYRMKHRALDELIDYARTFWSDKEMSGLMK